MSLIRFKSHSEWLHRQWCLEGMVSGMAWQGIIDVAWLVDKEPSSSSTLDENNHSTKT